MQSCGCLKSCDAASCSAVWTLASMLIWLHGANQRRNCKNGCCWHMGQHETLTSSAACKNGTKTAIGQLPWANKKRMHSSLPAPWLALVWLTTQYTPRA